MPRERKAAALEVLVEVLKVLLCAAVFVMMVVVFLAQFLPEPYGAMFRRWVESIVQCPSK